MPAPRDFAAIATKKEEKFLKSYQLKLREIENFPSSCPTGSVLEAPSLEKKYKYPEGSYIDTDDLCKYLKGEFSSNDYIEFKNFDIKQEPKVGIARDNDTHSSEEHLLYRVGMLRLPKLYLGVKFDGFSLQSSGFLKLGGEGKVVSYKESNYDLSPLYTHPAINSDIFKIYLATPAYFKNGWLPSLNFLGEFDKNLESNVPGTSCRVKLLTAATGKPVKIGGFDMIARAPKPMKTFVPAGSVYYFLTLSGDPNEIAGKIHGNSISDDEEYQKQGFGICFMGGYNA